MLGADRRRLGRGASWCIRSKQGDDEFQKSASSCFEGTGRKKRARPIERKTKCVPACTGGQLARVRAIEVAKLSPGEQTAGVMSFTCKQAVMAAVVLAFGAAACDERKPGPPRPVDSSRTAVKEAPAASTAKAGPVASVAVWSPPTPCSSVKACEALCGRCEKDECESDAASACHALGDLRLRGDSEQFDVAAAARAYDRGCQGGHALSCSALAVQVQDGRGVRRDAERASSLYERACEGGIGVGCYNLGLMLLHGGGDTIDEERARTFFHKARERYEAQCDAGDLQWCMNLGVLYENGHGVKQDVQRAQSIYDKACKEGHGDSCVNLVLTRMSTGRADREQEERILEARCEAGTALACGMLGELIAKGKLGGAPDPKRSVSLLERACTGGAAYSCATLGAVYALGRGGVKQDDAAANRYSARACDLGISSSCAAVGVEAAQREAWPEAQQYMQKACWIGDGEACAQLSVLVSEGKGSAPDPKRARGLMRDACRMGQGAACMDLFERKEPLPLPADRRQRFFESACKRGYAKACAELGL